MPKLTIHKCEPRTRLGPRLTDENDLRVQMTFSSEDQHSTQYASWNLTPEPKRNEHPEHVCQRANASQTSTSIAIYKARNRYDVKG